MIKLYRFLRECDQFKTWAKETEAALAEEASSENVEASRNKFDVCYFSSYLCFHNFCDFRAVRSDSVSLL